MPKQFPADESSLDELKAYFWRETATWEIVHGARYLAFLCIAVLAAGVFARTRHAGGRSDGGWGVVGLIGAALLLANGVITNGIEMFAFLDFQLLDDQPTLFWMVSYLTRVLFTAEMIAWSILTFGFSVAGWRSATLPKWLAAFGLISALASLLSSVLVVSIFEDGWATPIIEIASIIGLA